MRIRAPTVFRPRCGMPRRARWTRRAIASNCATCMRKASTRSSRQVLVYPTWWYGMPAILKGWLDRVWAPGVAFNLGDGAIQPTLTNIRRIAVVTTYGSPNWLLWYIGRIDRKLVGRGLRRLCAKDCRVEWVTLTRMDQRSRAECETFVQRVRAHFARW
jgi:putative NADPH-quinone reductase